MAQFTLRAHNSSCCFLPHTAQSHSHLHTPFIRTSLQRLSPSNPSLRLRVSSSSTQQDVKDNQREPKEAEVLTGPLRVNNVGQKAPISGSDEVSATTVGNWPPWKNIPQRYKLIGTTSLAFVICNMDKVNLSVAIIPMSHQFGWNSSMAGLVQSSFFWGYALSQLPGGWLAKIFGGSFELT